MPEFLEESMKEFWDEFLKYALKKSLEESTKESWKKLPDSRKYSLINPVSEINFKRHSIKHLGGILEGITEKNLKGKPGTTYAEITERIANGVPGEIVGIIPEKYRNKSQKISKEINAEITRRNCEGTPRVTLDRPR